MKRLDPAIHCLLDALEASPHIRGRDRLRWWLGALLAEGARRMATLPSGVTIALEPAMDYERSIWLKLHKQEELRALARLLRPGDVFVDVGANIGLWSLTAAQTVGPIGQVHAFEPNPLSADRLAQSAADNGFSTILQLHRMAVGERRGVASFMAERRHYLSRVVDEGAERTCSVEAVALDDLLSNFSRIDGMKIDVEGWEALVVRGCLGVIRRFLPWICVEFHGGYLKGARLGDWEVHALLRGIGYECFEFLRPEVAVSPTLAAPRRSLDLIFMPNPR